MEKNLKNNIYIYSYPYIYGYIYLNHFAVHLKLTQYCKSTVVQLEKKKKKERREKLQTKKIENTVKERTYCWVLPLQMVLEINVCFFVLNKCSWCTSDFHQSQESLTS